MPTSITNTSVTTDTLTFTASAELTGTSLTIGPSGNLISTVDESANNPRVGIGTTAPLRKLHVNGDNTSGAEISLTNTSMSADRKTMNWFMSGDKAHWRMLNDAQTAGSPTASLDFDGILDASAFTGTHGTSFGVLDSSSIGDSNVPYNSWGTPNNQYYRWVLPKAGTYLLGSNMRMRMWGVAGFMKARLYNNTTSAAINGGNLDGHPTGLGSQAHIRMLWEQQTVTPAINVNITANYLLTTYADNQDIHHQMWSTNNSASSSLQSDSNGRNIHWWQRIA